MSAPTVRGELLSIRASSVSASANATAAGDMLGEQWQAGVVSGIDAARALLTTCTTLLRERHARALSDHERDYAAGLAFAIRLIGDDQ